MFRSLQLVAVSKSQSYSFVGSPRAPFNITLRVMGVIYKNAWPQKVAMVARIKKNVILVHQKSFAETRLQSLFITSPNYLLACL